MFSIFFFRFGRYYYYFNNHSQHLVFENHILIIETTIKLCFVNYIFIRIQNIGDLEGVVKGGSVTYTLKYRFRV